MIFKFMCGPQAVRTVVVRNLYEFVVLNILCYNVFESLTFLILIIILLETKILQW